MYGEYPAAKILLQLKKDDLLPCILFRTSRKQCDGDVERIDRTNKVHLDPETTKSLEEAVRKVIAKYAMEESVILDHPHYSALVKTGVGAHHAGQLLVWRLVLEELMTQSMLRMMVATGTVAAGVDFPARTVVITAHSKRGSDGFNVLSAAEFSQMSGRAGRRGKDSVGICLIAPSPFSDARVLHQVARKPPEPLRSAYFAAPSTVLNLLKYRSVDDLHYTVSRSLASYLDRKESNLLREDADDLEKDIEASDYTDQKRKKSEKRVRRIRREAEDLEARQVLQLERTIDGLERLGHVDDGKLTEKGAWAAEICTTLVLELAEAVDKFLFDDVQPEELIALVASISGDSYRSYLSIKKNPIKKERYQQLQEVVESVRAKYGAPTSSDEVKVMPDAALTVLTWMESEDWGSFSGIIRLAGVAEGDVARLVSQTADHLNQLSRLRESHPDLALAATDAKRLILKPPITEAVAVAVV